MYECLAGLIDNLRLGVLAQVVREQEPDCTCIAIDDGAGVTAGIFGVIPDDLCVAPRLSAVGAAF
jgi:hypothetical protein